MTVEKATQLVNKLIEKTKSKEITWVRTEKWNLQAAPDKSFATYLNNGRIHVYAIFNEDSYEDVVYLDIVYENSLPPTELDFEDIQYVGDLVRLFNLIYESFPNPDKFVDEILAM